MTRNGSVTNVAYAWQRSRGREILAHVAGVCLLSAVTPGAYAQFCSYAPYTTDTDTVTFLNFNGSAGTPISQTGSISYVPGPGGIQQAASFAANAWAEYSVPLWSSNIPHAGTVEEWVKIASYGNDSLILNWDSVSSPPQAGYVLEVGTNSNGDFNVGGWNGGPFTTPVGTSSIPLNTWTQLAYTWGPNGTQLYVNGVLQASSPTSYGPFLDPTTYLYVNSWGGAPLVIAGYRISSVARTRFCGSTSSVALTSSPNPSTFAEASLLLQLSRRRVLRAR